MLLQIIVMLACFLAAIFQFAVHRSPDIRDSHITAIARKITVVSMVVAGLYMLYWSVAFGMTVQPPVVLIIGLFALGQLCFALNNLNYLKTLWTNSHHLNSLH